MKMKKKVAFQKEMVLASYEEAKTKVDAAISRFSLLEKEVATFERGQQYFLLKEAIKSSIAATEKLQCEIAEWMNLARIQILEENGFLIKED